MRFSFFYHSLVSDWNHGNAHFLRGVVSELLARGHQVTVYEPANGWSRENLLQDHGQGALDDFHATYPLLESILYQRDGLDLQQVAAASDVVIVHEWNEPWLVNELGELHERLQKGSNAQQSFRLLFHDTHHRAVSYPAWLKRLKLQYYDGILAFGDVLADVYRQHGWKNSVWTWHEAADTRVFFPREPNPDFPYGDLVWIGNWGDDERTRELQDFLFRPVKALHLDCHVYGVRYPNSVLHQLQKEQVSYGGWLPNFRVPDVFANHAVTVHVPRRYYAQKLPGIPTIRPFEAMACGIPLVSAPWQDSEKLFTAGEDYLVAHDTHEMQRHLHTILHDRDFAAHLAHHALVTIRRQHTCGHRVEQLLDILASLDSSFSTRFPLPVSSLTSRIGTQRQTVEGPMHA
jgi:spore maturation protein CgeB